MEYVFVYGTLRHGEVNHHLLKDSKTVTISARAIGRLVDTGLGYPALILRGESYVLGELYEVDNDTLIVLDELEGYFGPGDGRNDYERVNISVETDRYNLLAWTYVFLENSNNQDYETIDEGDWKLHRGHSILLTNDASHR